MCIATSIILLFVGFCSGYTVCNGNNRSTADSTASSTIREQLNTTREQLKSAESSLKSAQYKVTELESTINGAIESTEQNNKLIADAQVTSGDIGDSVEGLTKLFTEYTELVKQLQANNSELTHRLRSSVGETAREQ